MSEEKLLPVYVVDGEISFREFIKIIIGWWEYLLSKCLIIVIVGISGALLGLCLSLMSRPTYTAVTSFVLEEDAGGGGMLSQLGGLASIAGIEASSGGGLFQGENILHLYRSRSMIQKTLLSEVVKDCKKEILIDYFIRVNKLNKNWDKRNDLRNLNFALPQNANFSRTQDSIIGLVVTTINTDYLTVSKPDKKLSIIEVEVKSKDEFFAKSFNDQIVKNVNDFYVQTKTKKANENLAILQHQTDSVRGVLSGAIFKSAAVADATPNLNPSRLVLRAPAQQSQFNAEANKAILTQLVQNLELAKLSLRKETPLIQVVDQPVYPLKMQKLGKVKAIIIGGILSGFLIVFYLLLKRYFQTSTFNG